jgi:predicted Fe-Mo cluster-binding NifX family protein
MEENMKIAFITNDGKDISQHFGRASHYLVLKVKDGQVIEREMRDKLGHNQYVKADEDPNHTQGSGMDSASHRKHHQMAEGIDDCDVLICGGMGRGAYQSMQAFGIRPVVTEHTDIYQALQEFLEGKLKDRTEKLH